MKNSVDWKDIHCYLPMVAEMNLEEREEGEITEYEDISSDEENILRQRIAEIEKLAKAPEKEHHARRMETTTEIVTLTHVREARNNNSRRERKLNNLINRSRKKHDLSPVLVHKPRVRRRSRRLQKEVCQLILSEDEFDTYDALPYGTENLSPDPLPTNCELIDDSPVNDEEDEDLELKLRLEALQSKREIKNDLKVILKENSPSPLPSPLPATPTVDEEQELRLIALKSAIVKKHLVRKKRREEARPYSPTDDTLENFDVPSPPLSAQNMDISPLGSPSTPLSENNHAVDMEIANDQSQSPIFFACTVNTEPASVGDASALSRVEVQIDRSTMVVDSTTDGRDHDDDDPEKLRAFLLQKIGEAAKRKAMCLETDVVRVNKKTDQVPVEPNQEPIKRKDGAVHEEDNEHILRANLLSKARQFKKSKLEESEVVAKAPPKAKPLSEILSERSKKSWELKNISRTVENDILVQSPPSSGTTTATVVPPPPKPTRNALIRELRPIKVAPVIIALGGNEEEEEESGSEYCSQSEDESLFVDVADNLSPMSMPMDSPQCSSSPVPTTDGSAPIAGETMKQNFDLKLSEFLKKARQSTTREERLAVPMKKVVTTRRIVKKVANVVKTTGLSNVIQLGTAAAVRHLPPSTQLEYNRLINRMHQLERQKLIKTRAKNSQPKKAQVPPENAINNGETRPLSNAPPLLRTTCVVRTRPSPVKAPPRASLQVVNNIPGTVSLLQQPSSSSSGQAVTAASDVANLRASGRIKLKDRLNSLTEEQRKMLLDVQQRKVVTKRKLLNQSLDTFLDSLDKTMVVNQQHIRMELELRRLRKLLKQKEQSVVEHQQLCEGSHEKLQGRYQTVIMARQSLATTSAQCLEIGRSLVADEEKAEDNFRLTNEGSQGLAVKFKRYKGEIAAYKQLRQKIKKGTFTIADAKVVPANNDTSNHGPGTNPKGGETGEKVDGQSEGDSAIQREEEKNDLGHDEMAAVLKEERAVGGIPEPKTEMQKTECTTESLLAYKSPLEHMEYLDTASPNEILCPYQLNGTCQDDGCTFRHLLPVPLAGS